MAHSILIVDDEALTLLTIGRALETEGYEVLLASSGEEALQTIEEYRNHPTTDEDEAVSEEPA